MTNNVEDITVQSVLNNSKKVYQPEFSDPEVFDMTSPLEFYKDFRVKSNKFPYKPINSKFNIPQHKRKRETTNETATKPSKEQKETPTYEEILNFSNSLYDFPIQSDKPEGIVPKVCERCNEIHYCTIHKINLIPRLCEKLGSQFFNKLIVSCSIKTEDGNFCNGAPFQTCNAPEKPVPCPVCGEIFFAHNVNVLAMSLKNKPNVKKHSCNRKLENGEWCNCIPFTYCKSRATRVK